jgi:predicted Zn-dependent protease
VTPSSDPGSSIDATGRHRIDFAARPRVVTIAFALLWLSGWLLLLALTVLDYTRFGSVNLPGIVLLAGAGPPVALALLWAACGKRESLLVAPGEVRIDRWAGPIRLSRALEPHAIKGLRVANVSEGLLSDLAAVRQFYSGGNGRVAIDTDGRTFSVGHGISGVAAGRTVERIRQLVPQLSGVGAEPVGRRRRIAGHAATFMTMTMLLFALNGPFRIAVVDRPICFYNEAPAPRQPIDVSAMHPAGQVYLVPIDDFPVDRARAIAEHFRTVFHVAIDVAPAIGWPDDAYVPQRRQMNSAVMLTRLEETYASADPPVIAIALTTRDMFNPDVNWRYVFSYRRDNRLAVVSPARMDRGCMGLFPADEGRIRARLRKMVGKNVGIMYFGLGTTTDPASMLYGNIGGPQELDAMSELF